MLGGRHNQVDDDDLLARIQLRGRLPGRNESRRAVHAVVEALGELLTPRALHLIAEQLPADVRRRLPRPAEVARPVPPPTCRSFLARVGGRLHLEGPDAAFTARIVLEQLNATRRVITPAAFAHLVAPDLRPLLSAKPAPVADQLPPPRRLIRVAPTPTRPGTPARKTAPTLKTTPARNTAPEGLPGRVVA